MLFNPIYLLVGLLVFGVNVIPGLMPPTWLVLAFFYIQFDLELIPLVIIGATCATSGRVVLFFLAKYQLRRFLPKKYLENYTHLGNFFRMHIGITLPVVIAYAFSPIPSNQLFIIAGLAKLKIKIIALSFFAGRLISYTFWVTVAYQVADRLDVIFSKYSTSAGSIIAELLGIILIIVIGRINWKKILKIEKQISELDAGI